MSKSDFPGKVRRAIHERANGTCEVMIPAAGCAWYVQHYHHRKLRSQGGKGTADNGLGICGNCHTYIHANPALSYRNGWLVKSTHSPADTPVRRRGRLERLDKLGGLNES